MAQILSQNIKFCRKKIAICLNTIKCYLKSIVQYTDPTMVEGPNFSDWKPLPMMPITASRISGADDPLKRWMSTDYHLIRKFSKEGPLERMMSTYDPWKNNWVHMILWKDRWVNMILWWDRWVYIVGFFKVDFFAFRMSFFFLKMVSILEYFLQCKSWLYWFSWFVMFGGHKKLWNGPVLEEKTHFSLGAFGSQRSSESTS